MSSSKALDTRRKGRMRAYRARWRKRKDGKFGGRRKTAADRRARLFKPICKIARRLRVSKLDSGAVF
jgi:hypothetical protein